MQSTEALWTPGDGEVLSVSALLEAARKSLEFAFCDVWLDGEVVDLKFPPSGHAYFTIGDERCRIRAVCFKSTLRLLEASLTEGASMLFRGRLTVYEQRGDLQLVVDYAEPKGEGLLRLRLEALKKRLAAEGLFAAEKKKAIPAMPRAVALVTSPTGAAVRDMLQVLGRRAPWLDVYVSPCRVQGEGAAAELITALAVAASMERVDLILLGRGGGASEDLSAFNDEMLVRAVAACPKPVISAVGHEIDFTLTDFAADHRAPTPSAAAELAVRDAAHLLMRLARCETSLGADLRHTLARLKGRLGACDPSRIDPMKVLELRRIRVDRALQRAEGTLDRLAASSERRLVRCGRILAGNEPGELLARARGRAESAEAKLRAAAEGGASRLSQRLKIAEAALAALNPLAILSRGYSVTRDGRGRVVRSAKGLAPGEEVSVTLAEGSIGCRIEDVYER